MTNWENGTVESIRTVLSLVALNISYSNRFIIILLFLFGRSKCSLLKLFGSLTPAHTYTRRRIASVSLSVRVFVSVLLVSHFRNVDVAMTKIHETRDLSYNDRNNVLLLINSISIPNKSRITHKRNWCRFSVECDMREKKWMKEWTKTTHQTGKVGKVSLHTEYMFVVLFCCFFFHSDVKTSFYFLPGIKCS